MNTSEIRDHFPALLRHINNHPVIYLDGPAGTQVPQSVINAIADYYSHSNANTHGYFTTSRETDGLLDETRALIADFLNAPGPSNISFGANMTTLNFSLSKALVRDMSPGDEIVITDLDYEANRGPWLNLRQNGIVIKQVALQRDGTLDYEDFASKITSKTKLVCVGLASNLFGTLNEIKRVTEWARQVGALVLVDAVHYAPHFSIDVATLDCDFLLCSAYKFYGPHVGILYARSGVLQSLQTDFLRTQDAEAPYRIETGTLNHASIAGVKAALEFIKSLGRGETNRTQFVDAFHQITVHEWSLARTLADGIAELSGFQLWGPPMDKDLRAPTISFTVEGKTPAQVCHHLGEHAINAWDGHFYALKAIESLDLLDQGGVTRMGVVVYNTEDEIRRTLQCLKELALN